jgi:hypothetical protein
MNLDETSFPPAGYFFSFLSNLLSLACLIHGQYIDIIHRHFYSSIFLTFRFQKKLYPYLIGRSMTALTISSTFAFEDLSQDVLSVILSYVDISSA